MTTCLHPVLACETGTPAGTIARCKSCGIVTILPPARVHEGKWIKGGGATIAGMGLSAEERFKMELAMGHASALAEEGHWGARE